MVKKIWGRIFGLAWLKFTVAPLMCVSFWLLNPFNMWLISSWEKITVVTSWATDKMACIFTQNYNFDNFEWNSVILCICSAWEKCQKTTQMYRSIDFHTKYSNLPFSSRKFDHLCQSFVRYVAHTVAHVVAHKVAHKVAQTVAHTVAHTTAQAVAHMVVHTIAHTEVPYEIPWSEATSCKWFRNFQLTETG